MSDAGHLQIYLRMLLPPLRAYELRGTGRFSGPPAQHLKLPELNSSSNMTSDQGCGLWKHFDACRAECQSGLGEEGRNKGALAPRSANRERE